MRPPASQAAWAAQALQQRWPSWTGPFIDWSARVALHGPRWIPGALRKLPLQLGAVVGAAWVELWLWSLWIDLKRETPASVGRTPGVVIGADEGNGDGPHSRH